MEAVGFEKKLVDTLPQSSYPCLLHRVEEEDEQLNFHTIFEQHPYSAKFPYMYVWFSRDGWWVVEDDEDCLFILNPLTMERFELPKLDSDSTLYDCILTDSPKNPDCRLLLFVDSQNVLWCQIGDSEFTQRQAFGHKLRKMAVVGGRIYGLLFDDGLVRISFQGRNLEIMSVISDGDSFMFPSAAPPAAFHFNEYLIESNNEPLLVLKIYCPTFHWEVDDFRIYRVMESRWEEVKTIGDDRALFLDSYSGICCSNVGGKVKGNCIYYAEQHSHHVNMFDLKDGSITHLSLLSQSTTMEDEKHVFHWVTLPSA